MSCEHTSSEERVTREFFVNIRYRDIKISGEIQVLRGELGLLPSNIVKVFLLIFYCTFSAPTGALGMLICVSLSVL